RRQRRWVEAHRSAPARRERPQGDGDRRAVVLEAGRSAEAQTRQAGVASLEPTKGSFAPLTFHAGLAVVLATTSIRPCAPTVSFGRLAPSPAASSPASQSSRVPRSP